MSRLAFITGGARGIGAAIKAELERSGCNVVAPARAELDLADVASVENYLAAHSNLPVDILINNAGGRRQNIATEEMPLEVWRELMDLNLTSVFLCTKLIGGAMVARGQGGRIINIASINALVAGRKIAGRHYETSKAAVVQFTRATAADWAPHKITANAILPGGFMTDANLRWKSIHPEVIETFQQQIPLGRYGEPHELGPLAVYLASDASAYMTGASLVIDGGYTLW